MAARKRKAARDLRRAERTLERARAQAAEQARKREQEAEGVITRMNRLAEDNHLAALVWDVVAGSGNGGNR